MESTAAAAREEEEVAAALVERRREGRRRKYKREDLPVAASREEAIARYMPRSRIASASGAALHRLNALGYLRLETVAGDPVKAMDAFDVLLEATFPRLANDREVDKGEGEG